MNLNGMSLETAIRGIKLRLKCLFESCDPKSGAFFGVRLNGFLEILQPGMMEWDHLQQGSDARTYADAVIIEIAAPEEMAVAICDRLQPTDFIRFPGQDRWLFCWYSDPRDYPKLWKVKRKAGTIKRRLTTEEAQRQEALDILDKLQDKKGMS